MMPKHEITRTDIMDRAAYAAIRAERRRAVTEMKKNRRISVGPDATFYFENFETMCHQVHEMLYIEKGGEDQIADELAAYNPMIPKGQNLAVTFMIEIEDAARRARELMRLGGIEETISISFDGESVKAASEGDEERTTEEGKTSSVHFLLFPFTAKQIEKFRKPGQRVAIAIDHPNYGHVAIMPEAMRASLAGDFDD